MAHLNVVHFEIKEGSTKEGKPYKFLVIEGILILDDGSKRAGSMVFFDRPSRGLPSVEVGRTYEIVSAPFVDRDGKISIGIDALKPINRG